MDGFEDLTPSFGKLDKSLLLKLREISRELELPGEELYDHWESWAIEHKKTISIDNLDRFLREARKDKQKKQATTIVKIERAEPSSSSSSFVTAKPASMDLDRLAPVEDIKVNPKKRARGADIDAPAKNSVFSQRKDRGRIEASYIGVSAGKSSSKSLFEPDVQIHRNWATQALLEGYTWNYNWEVDTKEVLLARVQKLSSQILETSGIPPPADDEDGVSKLTDYTTIGTISTGSGEVGAPVDRKDVYVRELYVKPEHLDLAEMSDLALFRGQVVAIVGSNPHQRRLIAHSVHSIALPKPQMIDDARMRVRSRDLRMMVAAGPYTSRDDLSYEPLADLLKQVATRQPSLLVLMGPFVDERHPLIASGQANASFHQLCQSVMQKVQLAVDALAVNCRVVVLPSLHDVTHRSILPQPCFPAESHVGPFPSSFLRAPNPSVLRVNELDLAFVSLDVLKHLEQNSLIAGPNSNDRPAALVSFILQQQSFFPIYPPPIDVHIDTHHMEEGLSLLEMPDALFFASSLHPFVRIVNGVLAINLGNLVNANNTPGSFAEIKIAQVPSNSNASIVQRANVEIVRI